jgi:hypothetical protein
MVKLDYEQNTIFQRFRIEGEFLYSKLKQLLLEIGWEIYDIEYDCRKQIVFNGDLIMPKYSNRPVGRIGLVKNTTGKEFDGKLHYLTVEYEFNEKDKGLENFSRSDVDIMRKMIINRIERCINRLKIECA